MMLARYIMEQKKQKRLGVFSNIQSVLDDEIPKPQYVQAPEASVDDERKTFENYCENQIKNYMNDYSDFEAPQQENNRETEIWPPPLPPIPDFNIRHTVFTHKSMGTLYHASKSSNKLEVHNERYEFLGDSIVNMMFAIISCEKLPTVTEGDLTAFRRQLISNNTLALWAKIYELDKRLRITPQFVHNNTYVVGGNDQNKDTPKYVADVFEAYVGGLWTFHLNNDGIDAAFKIVKKWFESLSEPFFEAIWKAANLAPPPEVKHITAEKNELKNKSTHKDNNQKLPVKRNVMGLESMNNSINGLIDNRVPNKNAKSILYGKIGNASLKITYELIATDHDSFTVACKIGDEVLAIGKAKTIRDAGCFAAMAVIEDEDIIYKYSMKRELLSSRGRSENQQNFGSDNGNNQEGEDSDDAIIIGVSNCDDHSTKTKSDDCNNDNGDGDDDDDDDDNSVIITEENKSLKNSAETDISLNPKKVDIEKNKDWLEGIASERDLTPETIKKYAEDPVNTLKKFLKPTGKNIEYEYKEKENEWECTLLVDKKIVGTGTGSKKSRARKRASLLALLTNHQELHKSLDTGSSIS
ncbi:uncharacterized protein SAPINGB_P003382 [Magnusiomyces paraingens]|uniref:RNase III domain-containing protein n=1 Tax=Magnusiomyces paraingens TaxID=2606893 RepID=A0A5E8BUJ0_9ASCO|nr:uncharacterized protein SAPINGB_P003382 [Saprochaete ingens]VVT53057.1 unnamed protein product [Saprochaete ingens]